MQSGVHAPQKREMAMPMAAAAALALVAVMGVLAPRAAAQTPNCAAKQVPCSPYMNTTGTPPDTCCGPLKDAVQNDLKSLYDLYATPPVIFKAFNISLDEPPGLSKRGGSPARSDGRGVARPKRDDAYRPGSSVSRLSDPLPAAAAERAPAPTAKENARRAAPGAAAVPSAGKTPDAGSDAAAQPTAALRREDELVDGWPTWLLDNVPREALQGIVPTSTDAYDMVEKAGEGSYSRVYKARERGTGRTVALKKVRFDTTKSESVRFMAREIQFLRRLDHPNVMTLESIAISRRHRSSIYLVFDFMYSDLGRLVFRSGKGLTEPQIKRYMQQLLAGLQHCHERGILHLDMKHSNLLLDRHGVLKIGDFGLASYYGEPLTGRVVSLWYRAPELLLGSTTSYGVGVGIDLWSAGCLLAEMFLGKPLVPGGGEADQLLKIFSLFGSPPDDYWRKMELSPSLKPPEPYQATTAERFRDLPPSSLGLLATLLALDPAARGTAGQALQSSFFSTPPLPCDLSALPAVYKEEEEGVDGRKRIRRPSRMIRVKPGVPLNLFQDQEDDEWTDDEFTDTAANSGEEPVINTGNPGQESSAAANASSTAHDASSEKTIVNASSSSTVAKRFSGSPVGQEASPVQNQMAAQDQKQLPMASTSHHSGSDDDDDHENHHLVAAPDHDGGEGEVGEPPSGSGPESRSAAFVSDLEAAAAALRGSDESSSKQHVLVDRL